MQLGQAWFLGVGLLVAACSGVIGDPETRARGHARSETTDPASNDVRVANVPFARLTRAQYQSTLRDLFAPIAVPEVAPPADTTVGGFQGNRAAQTPSPALIEAYLSSAKSVARAVVAERERLLGCTDLGSRAKEDACLGDFVRRFGKRAYRRPLTDDEVARLVAFYASARDTGSDFVEGVTIVLESMLQSPHFLYRVELGEPDLTKGARVRLGSYEMASRLSYLFWNTMPDDALFAAADANELATPEGVEKQARRMLVDVRSQVGVREFFGQWLRLDAIDNLQKDAIAFPTFGAATTEAMRASADKLVQSVFFGARSFRTLLTDDHAWINDTLAPIYGVPKPGTNDLVLVPVDRTQRAGILTNAGSMAAFAHALTDAPVLRGVFVLDRILCSAPPPPPANVPPAPQTMAGDAKTTRQRFEQQHENGTCAACHKTIDPLGFAFGHYDAIGAWRTTDNGQPVDATGAFDGVGNLQGSFDGAVQMATMLADSPTVHSCFASQWARYALGVDGRSVNDDELRPVVDAFVRSNLDMQELVLALVKSDMFRTREVSR